MDEHDKEQNIEREEGQEEEAEEEEESCSDTELDPSRLGTKE